MSAWIDEDWATSFFELSFVPDSIQGTVANGSSEGTGLAGAEVIAAKMYLFEGSGLVLHCVWFQGSLYCVLAESVEDLPLLDVAFPDVTARNRVVQVCTCSLRASTAFMSLTYIYIRLSMCRFDRMTKRRPLDCPRPTPYAQPLRH